MPITEEERKAALYHLDETRRQIEQCVASMTEAQWNFRPSDDIWSAALICEHLAITERSILRGLQRSPADPARASEWAGKERLVLRGALNREIKLAAPERVQPKGDVARPGDFFSRYDEVRATTVAWVNDETVDPRGCAMNHPAFAWLDGYQWLLLMGSHCKRHVLQIEELKAHPDWPKD